MKVKKMFSKIIVTGVFVLSSMLFLGNVNAATETNLILGLEEYRSSGLAYKVEERIAWKISSYESLTSTTPNQSKTIYCIKGGPGFGSSEMGSTIVKRNYTKSFDLKDYDAIGTVDGGIYQAVLPEGENYNSLVWVLEHCYVPAKNSQEMDMASAFRQKLLSDADNYIKETRDYDADIQNSGISDDEIDVVQQLAIWYFTNNDSYKITDETFSLWVKALEDSNYMALGDKFTDGNKINEAAQFLFIYLVNGGLENKDKVPSMQNSQNTITIVDTGAAAEKVATDKYIVGPYKLETDATEYSLKAELKNSVGTELTYTILDSNKQATTKTLEELELSNEEFYLYVTTTESMKDSIFKVTMVENKTNLTYWSVAGANPVDQPVVEIERVNKETETTTTIREKIFDLALRKYITKVDGTELTNTRVPSIDTSKIISENMAEYKHRKDAVAAKSGSTITYKITVYNEGEQAGYATKVVDVLATGLKFKRVVSGNFELANYDEEKNEVTFARKSGINALNAFDGKNLASETIEIECQVTALPDTQDSKILTNVAYILESYNSVSNETITDQVGKDIDSEPATKPNVNKDNMLNYKGNSSNKEQLSDSDYFYKGEQDDDDFEKVVILPEQFDLALRKYITKIDGKVLTNTKEPNIDTSTIATNKTATYNHRKDAVVVRNGSKVTYNITIYNEGTQKGYATKVVDQLPTGLKFNKIISGNYELANYDETLNKVTFTRKSGVKALNAFDGENLASETIEIECQVTALPDAQNSKVLTNVAYIFEAYNSELNETITNQVGKDIDSEPATKPNVNKDNMSNYKGNSSNKEDLSDSNYFYKGEQDDDDFEKTVLLPEQLDMALRKYILKVNGNDVTVSRVPVISDETKAKLANGEIQTVTKEHTKSPVKVEIGDTVLYEIRVYNEGTMDGYVKEITDYLPEGLTLKENSTINENYGWTNPSGDGKTIVSTKIKDQLLKAFDGSTIDSAYVQVECIVEVEASQNVQNLKNIAEITKQEDKYGNESEDRDSTPKNLTDKQKQNYNPGESEKGWGYEDDDDFEIIVVPAKEFDLALRKFVTNINGKELVDSNGKYLREPTIDISKLISDSNVTTADYKHQKDPVGARVGDIVIYTLRIYNEGDLAGYASKVTDYLPPELEFVMDDEENFNASYGWIVDSTLRKATSTKLAKDSVDPEENLIKAFNKNTMTEPDYVELKIKCRVKSNVKLYDVVTNIAEITECTDAKGNIVNDKDSSVDNVILPTDENLPDYKGNTSNKSILNDKTYHYKGQEDDDDFEKLVIEEFDLALRKFITGVNDEKVTNRVPVFTKNINENGNYIYEHTKEPIEVETTDIVEYTIRIYNEGNIAGYAKEVKDNIPSGLEFLPENVLNKEYRWKMLDENQNETNDVSKAKYIVTDYLSKEQESTSSENLLVAFNQDTMVSPDYRDVKVKFKVIAPNTYEGVITNIAEISDDSDENGNEIEDIDSTPNNDIMTEDDIDVENIKLTYFDLALRKFITAVNDEEITNRYPVFKINENGEYVYEHTKEPVDVVNGSIVTYTIRVYNEGKKAGYAKEVKDNLPEGLEFLPENDLNKEYRWIMLDENDDVTEDASKAVSIVTDYLSKAQEIETGRNNLLDKFDASSMEEPDHRDVKVAFKVTEPNTSDRIIINKAQISDDSDKDGKDVVDKDSTPNKWIEGEDDQDIEKIRVKYFDLALRKWVTEAIVIQDGKEVITQTGHKAEDNPEEVVKVEIVESKLSKVVVKFKYKIRVTNEGEIPGYVDEISDYIPEGLRFVKADNPNWEEVEGKVVTDMLKNTLLNPGESAEVEILLTWNNGKNNLGLKVNVAEISKDRNDSNSKDIDSTPNNKIDGEDDIDDAPVILTIKTGAGIDSTYFILAAGAIAIISLGAIFIKKYVLK